MKTASDLGMTESEYSSLLKVRDMLANGLIAHAESNDQAGNTFDMDVSCDRHSCGTLMCIGGWVKVLDMNLPTDSNGVFIISEEQELEIGNYVSSQTGPLESLYFPSDGVVHWSRIGPVEAAKAIDNVLQHGDPDWPEAAPKAARGYVDEEF